MDKLQKRRNDCLRLLNDQYRKDVNCVKINTHNTLEHERAKFILCYKLIKEGYQIVTEAIFKNGSRADILVLDTFEVYEILKSETEIECLAKIKKYPDVLTVTMVNINIPNIYTCEGL